MHHVAAFPFAAPSADASTVVERVPRDSTSTLTTMGKRSTAPESTAAMPPLPPAFLAELENLAVRFIVNLPANELASIERIGFQVEQACVSSWISATDTGTGFTLTFCALRTPSFQAARCASLQKNCCLWRPSRSP